MRVSDTVSPIVHPSDEDPVAAGGSEALGGPIGRAARYVSWWLPVRVLIVITALSYALGYLLDYSCRATGWAAPERYEHLCYSDIPALYNLRGFVSGYFPYLQTPPGGQPLEYPVLTGLFMQVSAMLARIATNLQQSIDTARNFFDVNVVLLFIPLVITVIATSMTVRRRPWDALMVAAAPTMILAATINWDLLPLAFSGVAFVLWSRKHEFSAGLLLGLAIAAKFYPVIFLAAFVLLSIRTGTWKALGRLLLGTAITWLVVNIPFIIGNFDGWWYFYGFSKVRGEDFGSPWYGITQLGINGVPADSLNTVATGSFLVLAAGIGVLALAARRRPRLPQLFFLLIAAFVITNKVYSPQYVLWLIPLAVLARPKWRDFLIWQVGELIYFVGIWWFLVGYGNPDFKGLPPQLYSVTIFIHIAATIYFAVMVIRDIVRPENDPIRTDAFEEDRDDPAGGVYDNAPDVFVLGGARTAR